LSERIFFLLIALSISSKRRWRVSKKTSLLCRTRRGTFSFLISFHMRIDHVNVPDSNWLRQTGRLRRKTPTGLKRQRFPVPSLFRPGHPDILSATLLMFRPPYFWVLPCVRCPSTRFYVAVWFIGYYSYDMWYLYISHITHRNYYVFRLSVKPRCKKFVSMSWLIPPFRGRFATPDSRRHHFQHEKARPIAEAPTYSTMIR
jgi:hypothetical protein